jgi:hypothetical protein
VFDASKAGESLAEVVAREKAAATPAPSLANANLEPLSLEPLANSLVDSEVSASSVGGYSLVEDFEALQSPGSGPNTEASGGADVDTDSSNTQRVVQGQADKERASMMRRCYEPGVDEFETTEQVQAAIDGVKKLKSSGAVPKSEATERLLELYERKDELQQVKRARDEVESGNSAPKGNNQRTI